MSENNEKYKKIIFEQLLEKTDQDSQIIQKRPDGDIIVLFPDALAQLLGVPSSAIESIFNSFGFARVTQDPNETSMIFTLQHSVPVDNSMVYNNNTEIMSDTFLVDNTATPVPDPQPPSDGKNRKRKRCTIPPSKDENQQRRYTRIRIQIFWALQASQTDNLFYAIIILKTRNGYSAYFKSPAGIIPIAFSIAFSYEVNITVVIINTELD